jgi:hypothetical protein
MTTLAIETATWHRHNPDVNTGNVPITCGAETVAFAVCEGWGYEKAPSRAKAKRNACMIAAAPKMLRACKHALTVLEAEVKAHDEILSACRAAFGEVRTVDEEAQPKAGGDLIRALREAVAEAEAA